MKRPVREEREESLTGVERVKGEMERDVRKREVRMGIWRCEEENP